MITLENGTQVYVAHYPHFLGNRIRLRHKDAPLEVSDVELGRVVENAGIAHLQLPEAEFAVSPAVLRAAADLLEGAH